MALIIHTMAAKYTSFRIVIDKILRDSLFNGLNYEAAVDYCIDFINIVGLPYTFEEKHLETEIVDYRCQLPPDYVGVIQVMINQVPARTATDTIAKFYPDLKTRDNYTYDYDNDRYSRSADYTFKIEGDVIYTSVKKGKLLMVYEAIPLTEDNEVAIPDDPTFIRALRAYIEKEHIRILWRHQKVSDKVYEDAQQEYAFAVGACETNARRLELPDMEAFCNMYKTLLVRDNEYFNRFRNLGAKEILKRH